MYKATRKLMTIAVIVIAAAMLCVPAAAMDFTVMPELPDNQRNNGNSFFDLKVYPGQEQDITIWVRNVSDKEITVLIELITASTNGSGGINYTSKSVAMDETLKYSFEDIASIPDSHYTIPAEGSINIPVSLAIPEDPFEGMILGSIRVLREVTEEERAAAGAIVNQYAYVTAVRLVQDEIAVEAIVPDFALADVTTQLVNYRAAITANVRNPMPIVIKEASASAKVFPKGESNAIFERTLPVVDFAPNSIFPFSLVDNEGYGIEAGDYTALITIEHKGEIWSFERDFTIAPQEAAAVNEGALNQTGTQRPVSSGLANVSFEMPTWILVAIGLGIAILISMIVLIVVLLRNRARSSVFRGIR